MIKRKYSIPVFFVSCLVATLFIGTTASETEYNPWADVDVHGDVDMGDQRRAHCKAYFLHFYESLKS